MASPRKYARLNRYLAALPPAQPGVTLSFAVLEAVLGHALPRSRVLTSYWARGAVPRDNWERLGFTAQLDRGAGQVTFTRRGAAPQPPDLPASPPPCRTRAAWQCRGAA
jgi:hypothetical protein